MRGIRIFKWTFLILGLVLSSVALLITWANYRLITNGTSTQGTVVEVIRDGNGSARVVEFHTAEGRAIRFEESGRSSSASYSVGDAVQVLYFSKEPQRARDRRLRRQNASISMYSLALTGARPR